MSLIASLQRIGRPSRAATSTGPQLNRAAHLYIIAVCLLGLGILIQLPGQPPEDLVGLGLFIILGSLAQLMPIQFHQNAAVSMSMAIALATIVVFGPIYAAWVNVASCIVQYLTLVRPHHKPFYRSAATAAILVIAAWTAGQVYLLLGGQMGLAAISLHSFLALGLAALLYYALNSSLVTAAIALEARRNFWELLRKNLQWLTINIASLTPLGFGVAFVYLKLDWVGLALYLIPMVLAWYSFRLYTKTVADVQRANDDLKDANELVRRTNEELQRANALVQETNTDLIEANERLSIMIEVSQSLLGSLVVEETLGRIVKAVKEMGFSEGFIAGPIDKRGVRIGHWRASHAAYAQWMLVGQDHAMDTAARKLVVNSSKEAWFAGGEIRVLSAAESRLQTNTFGQGDGESDPLAVLTLVPVFVGQQTWGLLAVGSPEKPTAIELKELMIFRSIAGSAIEMALAHEQAQRDALIDTRTGLYNHRYFQEALQRELQEATRRDSFLSFLMIDINKFKEFNDLYGHLTGDQVLQVIARLIRDNIRETDIACRYGGDEMCVLLPHADRARALEVAYRIDRAIAGYSFRARRDSGPDAQVEELHLRVSIGVATFPEAAQTRAGLVEQADRACYRAKALGGGVAAEGARADPAPLANAAPAAHPARLQVVK